MTAPDRQLLIVEDDHTIREALRLTMEREGFGVVAVEDGPAGLAAFFRARPDLVLLDLGLPGMDGIDVCRTIRADGVVPVVMLTARSDSEQIVAGLEAGADDYVVKPFDPPVLAARLRAVLRRAARDPSPEVLRVGDLELDVAAAVVTRAGTPVALTATEYRLLLELMRHAGAVRSRDQLLQNVWDYAWSGDTRLVDVHIQRLRGKVGRDVVETVRSMGYRVPRR